MKISYNTKQIFKDLFKLGLIFVIGYLYFRWPFYKYFPDIWWTFWAWIGGWFVLIKVFTWTVISLKKRVRGIEGEWDVADILNKLPRSHISLPNINLKRRGDIDFVLIGPTGIWTIEVKSHAGNITFNGTELTRDEELFEKDFLKQAWAEACLVRDLLKQKFGQDFTVKPVIVFSSPDAEIKFGFNQINGIYVIGLRWLKKLVLGGKDTLKTGDIEVIADIIEKSNIKD